MTASDGLFAISSAFAKAVSKSSAGAVTAVTRPMRSASSAATMRPVRHISVALPTPTSSASRRVDPSSGISPILMKRMLIFASAEAIRTSNGRTIVRPIPTAKPLIAATVGFDSRTKCVNPAPPRRIVSPCPAAFTFARSANPPRSAPAQKARPSAASRIAPMPGSAFQAAIWSWISAPIWAVHAFSFSGRLSRMTPTRPRVSERICS